ncbi:MAG: hypothetical protein MZV63_33310 [Marinilabiliales bacterium]|nr:hypothetical protein [Marinilabiliales bacterium]
MDLHDLNTDACKPAWRCRICVAEKVVRAKKTWLRRLFSRMPSRHGSKNAHHQGI